MKVVILAGGLGSRISEESILKPKPLIEIGGRPIIWHIMKQYSYYGLNDFIICCGYKGYLIKEYFVNYSLHTTDITVNVRSNKIKVHKKTTEPWNITMVNTGEDSLTGDRIREIKSFIDSDFCLTYGDGLSSVNIKDTIKFHKKNNKIATVVAVKPTGRFGAITLNGNLVKKFFEKPKGDGALINAGFFVLSPEVIDYIDADHTVWEQEPLMTLAEQGELMVFRHLDFWQPMDTLRDKNHLNKLWGAGKAPWKTW